MKTRISENAAPVAGEAVDAVTLSVVWSALVAIPAEMGVALRNTAYSSAVREGDDFSQGLFDRRGRLVAQGNFTPGHQIGRASCRERVCQYLWLLVVAGSLN